MGTRDYRAMVKETDPGRGLDPEMRDGPERVDRPAPLLSSVNELNALAMELNNLISDGQELLIGKGQVPDVLTKEPHRPPTVGHTIDCARARLAVAADRLRGLLRGLGLPQE